MVIQSAVAMRRPIEGVSVDDCVAEKLMQRFTVGNSEVRQRTETRAISGASIYDSNPKAGLSIF